MNTDGYSAGEHFDEMFTPDGQIRSHYEGFFQNLKKISTKKMNHLQYSVNQTQRAMGMTFNVYHDNLDDGHELHACLKVYLPGAGWIGMDPSLGLLTDHQFIPLATQPEPRKMLSVQGTFFRKCQCQT